MIVSKLTRSRLLMASLGCHLSGDLGTPVTDFLGWIAWGEKLILNLDRAFWWQHACENLEEGSSVCAHSRWEVCLSRSRVLPPIVRQPTSSGFQCRLKARQCCRTSLDSRTRLGLLRHQSPGLNNFHILGLLVRRAIIGYSYHSLYVSQANECPLNVLI